MQEVLPGLSPAAAPTMLGVLGAPLPACNHMTPGTHLAHTYTWHALGRACNHMQSILACNTC